MQDRIRSLFNRHVRSFWKIVNSYEVIKDRTKMWLRLFLEVKFDVILFMSNYFSSIIIFFPRYILRNLSHHTFTFFPITFGGSIKTPMDLITSIWKERINSTMLLKIHIRGLQTKKMSRYLFSKSWENEIAVKTLGLRIIKFLNNRLMINYSQFSLIF